MIFGLLGKQSADDVSNKLSATMSLLFSRPTVTSPFPERPALSPPVDII